MNEQNDVADPEIEQDRPEQRRILRGVSPALAALGQIERILGEFDASDQMRMLEWLAHPLKEKRNQQ